MGARPIDIAIPASARKPPHLGVAPTPLPGRSSHILTPTSLYHQPPGISPSFLLCYFCDICPFHYPNPLNILQTDLKTACSPTFSIEFFRARPRFHTSLPTINILTVLSLFHLKSLTQQFPPHFEPLINPTMAQPPKDPTFRGYNTAQAQ